MHNRVARIADETELLLLELKHIAGQGPHFRIVHRFQIPGAGCMPGEEVLAVQLLFRGRECWVPFSLTQRLLFDYLSRHMRFPQSAQQIELGVRSDQFHVDHASNPSDKTGYSRAIPRSSVRVHIARIREALRNAFRELGFAAAASDVLVSEQTTGNEVGYRLKAHVEWVHLD